MEPLKNAVSDGSVYLVDTDTIAHNVLLPDTPDSVYDQVVQVFGAEHDILVDNNNYYDDDDNKGCFITTTTT